MFVLSCRGSNYYVYITDRLNNMTKSTKLESKPDDEENDTLVIEGLPTDIETQSTCSNKTESTSNTETDESTESVSKSCNIFEELSNVNIDNVKCRRGRPKGTKKPFWSFSNSKSKQSDKKRKANDELPNPSKVAKCNDKETNKNQLRSTNKNNEMPNPSKEAKCNDKATHENQTQSNDKKATMVKTEPVSNEIDRRVSDKETQNKNTDPDKHWLKIFNLSLKQKDKNIIINKDMLNDRIIDAAQIIMKNQFKHSPQINGFQPTIFKQNTKHFKKTNKDMLQILHRGSANSGHWFSVSTLNCDEGSINIYDSAFNDLDHDSKAQISSILKFDGKFIKLHKVPVQHQAGGSDCGLFAIAFAVALCFGLNPSKLNFQQHKMGDHFLHCLAENKFTNFPFNINPNWKKKKIVTQKEKIFCSCRVLYDSEMAKCISCDEWFHLRCISSREAKNVKKDETYQYTCSNCSKSQ